MSSRENYGRLKETIMLGVLSHHMDSYHEEVKKAGGKDMPEFQSISITRVEVYKAVGEFLEEKGITEAEFLCWLDEIRRRTNEVLLTEKLDEIVEDQRLVEGEDEQGEEWKKS